MARDLARVGYTFEQLQVRADRRGCGVSQISILRDALIDDFFQLRGNVGIQSSHGCGSTREDGLDNRAAGSAAKGRSPRGHFVKQQTQSENVRTSVQVIAANMFRGHVRRGATDHANDGDTFMSRFG